MLITIIKNLTKTSLSLFLFCLSLVFLSACSSQSKKPSQPDKLKAAHFNAQLGGQYLRAGRLKLANQKLTKALEQNNNSSEAHHYYALLQQKIGDETNAGVHFKKAVSINHEDPNLLNNFGSHLCQTGEYAKAVKQFDLASKSPFYKTPEFAYTNAGICLRKMKDDARAEQYLRKALASNTNFGSALFQMAKLNYDQGNLAKAQAFLLRYDENNQPMMESLALCTKINKQLGDIKKANYCLEKKLQLFPK